jgi:hypothetical protein
MRDAPAAIVADDRKTGARAAERHPDAGADISISSRVKLGISGSGVLTPATASIDDAMARKALVLVAFKLERQFELHAIQFNLAVLDLNILFHDLRDAQIAQCRRRALDSCLSGFVPGFGACSDEFDDLVNALSHADSPCLKLLNTHEPKKPAKAQA